MRRTAVVGLTVAALMVALSGAALAATLSGNYGIYNGFELIEHEPIPGKEEYLNSEKYQIRTWDLEREDSLRDLIALVNRIRRARITARVEGCE